MVYTIDNEEEKLHQQRVSKWLDDWSADKFIIDKNCVDMLIFLIGGDIWEIFFLSA